ncbi:uncharacterized protein LOC128739781 [Sabethes cyaneus]|uniref:uncharacterized protein LOC128739781 n=1 Tax=Sabethes cyaneus TaxID=53552 RepID=UPI00237DFA75|nr:uncharacterized protein LOC128739781 [Sabethes cyaneus]
MTSSYNDYTANVECLVTPQVAGTIPCANVRVDSWHIPSGIVLANVSFTRPREVDMLIGARHFFDILEQGQIKLANHLPTLYETQFGCIAGSYDETEEDYPRYFKQEDIGEPAALTTEEVRFEEHCQRTYHRNAEGRFVVQLLFRESVNQLGSSSSLALKRFLLLEKRLARDPDLKAQYLAFIDEYQSLGHCREIKEEESPDILPTASLYLEAIQ